MFIALEDCLTNLDSCHSSLVSRVSDIEGGEDVMKLVYDLQSVRNESEVVSSNFHVMLNESQALEGKLRESFKDMTSKFESSFGEDRDYKLDLEQIKDKSQTS